MLTGAAEESLLPRPADAVAIFKIVR